MRKKRAEKRKLEADSRYGDMLVTRFINNLMIDGKKNVARNVIYGAFSLIREKTGNDELEVFRKAIANVSPAVEVRSRRIGGTTYQVPVDVSERRRLALAIRWIKRYSRERREKTMIQRLAAELIAASNGEGSSVKKREDVHRMAEANKAFAHFKW